MSGDPFKQGVKRPGAGAARRALLCLLGLLLLAGPPAPAQQPSAGGPEQYLLLNCGGNWEARRAALEEVRRQFPPRAGRRIQPGVGIIVSYLNEPRPALVEGLRQFLELVRQRGVPVLIQLDGEQWWTARPDLWNWWDPAKPGYDPANRMNVEWTGWGPENAIRIAWRNWGRQIRVLPPPNLMSPRYREACHAEMDALLPVIVQWWRSLPEESKGLLVGVKVGWESSVGTNAFYYPNGNALADRPARDDPRHGLKADMPPGRGVTTIGYAAVASANLRTTGTLTEADLAEIARRHMEDLARRVADHGLPRGLIFTHGAGWKEEELLYDSAVNAYSCPGWSFYRYAGDPARDLGVRRALARSDAPCWAVAEWLFQGKNTVEAWSEALRNTLRDPRCRYMCIYNWNALRDQSARLEAIRLVLAGGAPPGPKRGDP